MTTAGNREQLYFDLAFELAYCLHAHKEVAFFVAEDALNALASTLGHQEKNRTPAEQLRGFLKWGERTRPVRKTVSLSERQMLQWLVYKQSEAWERQTERGEGLYLPTEEDLIVRYIEQLVFITLRRGSFYVTLAVCSLLHQFNRRETRLFYDILTQSDSARMKDANYIGKQRLEMLERISRRFGDMVQIANAPGDEKQFVMRPTNQRVIELVHESLRRFAPWETACVVEPGFDVTDIPGLYFSESGSHDEELIEMNRIRSVLDPGCFTIFAEGLSKYVQRLPIEDQDSSCDYSSPDAKLSIPQFSNFPSGTTRGDRFQPPKLTKEDYVRLQRTLDARGHRRKVFTPRQLRIYVDDVLSYSFDLKTMNRARLRLGAEACIIEVRGLDDAGELTLATIFLTKDQILGGTFADSIVHEGGQKLTVRLSPVSDAGGAVKGAQLEVSYAEASLMRIVLELARRVRYGSGGTGRVRNRSRSGLKSGNGWLAKAVVAALIIAVSALLWWRLSWPPSKREMKPVEQEAGQPHDGQTHGGEQEGTEQSVTSATPAVPTKQSPTLKEVNAPVARASWSTSREEALLAVTVEPTRGETQTIDLSRRETRVFLSLPLYDDEGRAYSHYRLTLSASEKWLWQQTLRAPKGGDKGYDHILSFSLLTRQLPKAGPYDLQVEGFSQGFWSPLGHVVFSPKER